MAPTERARLLLVEDETSLAGPIRRGLEEEGYVVDVAGDGESGLRQALTVDYALLIVDWRLPGMDGRTLVERMRGAKIETPVLMLTAMRDVEFRVAGLDAGADDYLVKPFAFEELVARLRALHRRSSNDSVPVAHQEIHLEAGPLRMDTSRLSVHLAGRPLSLRAKEFRLLELLLRLDGGVATRTLIAEHVWGSALDVTDNAIDVTISNLRRRLKSASRALSRPVVVDTVRGMGYRIRIPDSDPNVKGGD